MQYWSWRREGCGRTYVANICYASIFFISTLNISLFTESNPLLPFQLDFFLLFFLSSSLSPSHLHHITPLEERAFSLVSLSLPLTYLWPDNPSPQRPRPSKPSPRLHPRPRSLEPRLILLAPNRESQPANGGNFARRPTTRTLVQRPLPLWQTPCLRIPIY